MVEMWENKNNITVLKWQLNILLCIILNHFLYIN